MYARTANSNLQLHQILNIFYVIQPVLYLINSFPLTLSFHIRTYVMDICSRAFNIFNHNQSEWIIFSYKPLENQYEESLKNCQNQLKLITLVTLNWITFITKIQIYLFMRLLFLIVQFSLDLAS